MTDQLTRAPRKPVLDEGEFQQLLAAAYVLQEHQNNLVTQEPHAGYLEPIHEIIETQKQIQNQDLDLQAAMVLIAERVQGITNACGVAIGIIEQEQLAYQAGCGNAASETGGRVPLISCLSAECLRTGEVLQCADITKDAALSKQPCVKRGVTSIIAVPVYHGGKVAGALELRFSDSDSYHQQDSRICQLMAGLVTEAIHKASELELKRALAAERANTLEALEKIKPQLERLSVASNTTSRPISDSPDLPSEESCRACGHAFEDGESFCGNCGTVRPGKSAGVQGKWASLWRMRQATLNSQSGDSHEASSAVAGEIDASVPSAPRKLIGEPPLKGNSLPEAAYHLAPPEQEEEVEDSEGDANWNEDLESDSAQENESRFVPEVEPDFTAQTPGLSQEAEEQAGTDALVPLRIVPDAGTSSESEAVSPWTSASKARRWLDSVKAQPSRAIWLAKLWQTRRADIYVAVSALLLLVAFWSWVTHTPDSNSAAGNTTLANGHRGKNPSQPNLTFFEQLLVNLGMAEAPSVPLYLGNPDTKVWVDLHTALYYCPGSAFYGKTEGGKITTQKDAQQDQFSPAKGKACD